jgi:hypothetical protein
VAAVVVDDAGRLASGAQVIAVRGRTVLTPATAGEQGEVRLEIDTEGEFDLVAAAGSTLEPGALLNDARAVRLGAVKPAETSLEIRLGPR